MDFLLPESVLDLMAALKRSRSEEGEGVMLKVTFFLNEPNGRP